MKRNIGVSMLLLMGFSVSFCSYALPSKDDAHAACVSVMARTTLDPVIDGLYGDQLSKIAVRDCIVVVGEADGDPKKAADVARKLKSDFSKSMWQMVGSPYTTQQDKSMALNMEGWHSSVMNKAQVIAGNYKALQEEARRAKSVMAK